MAVATKERWPELDYDQWADTLETVHMWTQIVGKTKLANCPFLNQWWEIGFQLTPVGLTSGQMESAEGLLAIDFDFLEHVLTMRASSGLTRSISLYPRSVADFFEEYQRTIALFGVAPIKLAAPAEVPDPIPFAKDTIHASYDPDAVIRWFRVMASISPVLQRYRSPFTGKSSPILFYWGSFDLNATRFSGRNVTPPAGPRFYQLAENQENISCGFWPGNVSASGSKLGKAAFYAYTFPSPKGLDNAHIEPAAAHWDKTFGEFIYLYDDLRSEDDPDAALLSFFESTYRAGAGLANWDLDQLEQHDIR
ncbi:MAG: hypothetical protein KC438_00970 [Thermomicrobiales bacterium]|nr:hypothetical protein [Thermomicrobiales bacterium]